MAVAKRTSLALPVAEPFDFGRSAEFAERFIPSTDSIVRLRDAVVTGGFAPEPFVAHLSVDGHGSAGRRTRGVDADDSGLVHARVQWVDEPGEGSAVATHLDAVLSLSTDLSPLYDAAGSDPAFARVVADVCGYHPLRFTTPFEAACWTALSRQTPTVVAVRRKRSLADAVGRVVSVDHVDLRLFPTPERVATAPDAVRATLSDRTARTVLDAAEAFSEEDLDSLPTRALVARLCEIRGFDRQSAAAVGLRGFGRASLLPLGECRLRAAVEDAYGLEAASDDDVERLSEPYGDYCGHWARYLRAWASLRTDGEGD